MEINTIWIINHYADIYPHRKEGRVYNFALNLIRKGYKVHVFTASTMHNTDFNMIEQGDKDKHVTINIDNIAVTYIKVNNYSGNGFSRIKNMINFAKKINKVCGMFIDEKPSVVYTSAPHIFAARSAEKFAKTHKIPCLVEIRDLWPLSIVEYMGVSNHNPIIRGLYSLEKKIYSRADALVFTMAGGKEYITDKKWDKKINLEKVFYVNNGLDVEEQERQRKEFVLDDPDLNDDSFKVIYAGSIRTANSVDLLVKAAEKLTDYPIKFLIYGDGDSRNELEKYCLENQLTNVRFKGKVDKKYIPYICSKASVNVLTYKNAGTWKYGGSQNKMFDYMNSGRPIVTNIQMGYSLLKQYKCGIELENNEVMGLADNILQIFNLPEEEYEKMCQNAKNAAKDFDYEILTNKIEEAMNYAIEHYER